MDMHKENINNSALSEDECTSKFDEKEPRKKKLKPVDFLLVTRIPMKVCTFQWIIRQFSILPKNITLYSTCIHVSDTSCYKLKLIKCDHGFNLFHVREKSCGKNVVKNQNKLQSSEINNVPACTGFQFGSSGSDDGFGCPRFQFTSSSNETKGTFGNFQFSSSSSETKSSFGIPQLPNDLGDTSESGFGKAIFPSAHVKPPDVSSLPVQKEPKKAQSAYEFGITRREHARLRVASSLPVLREPKEAQSTYEFGITRMEYLISATDNQGKELMKWSVCFSNKEFWGYKIGEYINNSLERFPDDSLILNCKLKVISTPTSEEMAIASEPSLKCNGWKKLSEDFKAVYQNSLDTDVTLVIGNEKICAHKLILAARSSIFDKIFHRDMKKTVQNSVTITDVQFQPFKKLIEFLYSGDILEDDNKDMDLKEIYDFYYAADKYQVMDLRRMIGNTLMGRIQVDNASELLVWADRHNDEDLKSRIMNFIRINFEEVINSDAWKSFTLQYPRLAVEVVNLYIENSANKV